MNSKEVSTILGIEKVEDINEVKNAYRSKLVHVNPEDDPEGFMRLRNAYEKALIIIEEKGNAESSIYDELLEKIEQEYFQLSRRIDIDVWKDILNSEIFIDLETEKEASIQLLQFFSAHYYLPQNVSSCICNKIKLKEFKDSYSESVPLGFIEYFIRLAEEGCFIDFNLFEGDDNADYDGYIKSLYNLIGNISREESAPKDLNADSKNLSEIQEEIDSLKKYSIYHPYLDVQRIRAAILAKNFSMVKECLEPLESRFMNNNYIAAYIAFAYWALEDFDKSVDMAQMVLNKDPDFYLVRKILCDNDLRLGNYQQAKEGYYELLEGNRFDNQIGDAIKIADQQLIKKLSDKLDPTNRIELAWCLFETDENQKAYDALMNIKPIEAEDVYQYYNTLSRVCSSLDKHKEAIDNSKKWLECINGLVNDGSKEFAKKNRRRTYASFIIADNYRKLTVNLDKNSPERNGYLEKALKYTEIFEEEENLFDKCHFICLRANIFKLQERYFESIEECNKVIELDPQFLPAYIVRQENYFEIKSLQWIWEDYYNIVSIVPNYSNTYLLLAKALFYSGNNTDAEGIIKKALDEGAMNNDLKLLDIEIQISYSQEDKELTLIQNKLAELELDIKNERDNSAEILELNKIKSRFYLKKRDYCNALEEVNDVLKQEQTNEFLALKADILYKKTGVNAALGFLNSLELLSTDDGLNCILGRYYINAGLYDRAIEVFCKALKINDKCYEADYYLIRTYMDQYLKDEDSQWFYMAEKYANHGIKYIDSSDTYRNRGLLYMQSRMFDKAISDLLISLEMEPDNAYSLDWLGESYRLKRDYANAEEAYKRAIEVVSADNYTDPYYDLAICYEMQGKNDEALKLFKLLISSYPNTYEYHRAILRVLLKIKEYDEYIEKYKYLSTIILDAGDIGADTALCYELQGNFEMAEKTYSRALKEKPKSYILNYKYADYIVRIEKNYKKAGRFYKTAFRLFNNENAGDLINIIKGMAWIKSTTGKNKKAAKYLEKALIFLNKTYGGIDNYLKGLFSKNIFLFNVATLYFSAGDNINAEKYFNAMDCNYVCISCSYNKCVEWHIGQAMLYEQKGEYEKALDNYKVAIEEKFDLEIYVPKVMELEKKIFDKGDSR